MAFPADQLFHRAIWAMQSGKLDVAEQLLRQTIERQPGHIPALNVLSTFLAAHGRLQEGQHYMGLALAVYDQVLRTNPNLSEAWLGRAQLLSQFGRHAEAIDGLDRAVANNRELVPAHLLRAKLLADLGRHQEALDGIDKLLEIKPSSAEASVGRGNILFVSKRYHDALDAYGRACALNPALPEAWLGCGNTLSELRQYEDSLAAYDRALGANPQLAGALLGRGNVLSALKRYEDALVAYDKAIGIAPDFPEAWLNRGNLLNTVNRHDEALAAFRRALALRPDLAEAWLGQANVFFLLKRYQDAASAYERALAIRPDLVEAQLARGNVFSVLKQHRAAADAYAAVLRLAPERPFTKGLLLHQNLLACDWSGSDALMDEIEKDLAAGRLSADPFILQGLCNSPQSLKRCAELYTEERYPARIVERFQHRLLDHNKIRIGYLSGEFREQATSHLIAGVLEKHDPSRFEVYAFDNGWDDRSEIRRRINAAVREMIGIRQLSDASALAAIRDKQIDVLVNLNGYFGEQRSQLFANRAAPIQVNYLGFPGTLGASYIDYIIADRHVIPENHKTFYDEKVVYLPNCYQANDSKRKIAASLPSRLECGLPKSGFVFCCFNNSYKILPDVFDRWMQILSQVEGSVLWLLSDNQETKANIQREACARNIDPQRLIFAKLIPHAEHLARHAVADLFLDTVPCNAHTTASDALWAGLPLLTCMAETFSGRVAASLLHAIGLRELVTTTLQDYERLAVDLALRPEKLASLKDKLAKNRFTAPLFNTELFTEHLEAAYVAMFDRYHAGARPDHIQIGG
jgi:predicted O-linked N-acetylglucosamine transferase (SPINDLY family)